jgi:diguanylate cyclase (GGDEF)-like protein/PAS domain S-box-containing protein
LTMQSSAPTADELRLLAMAVEQSPLSIVVTDTQGNLIYVNDYFTEVTGYRREEVLGRNPRILQSGETPMDTYRDLWKTIASGRTWRGELLNRRKDGDHYWEMARISPVRDAQGTISHYIGIKENITEQRQVARALAESESNLRQAQSVAHIGSWALDLRRQKLEWSDETYRIFGLPVGSPVDLHSFLNLIHPDDQQMVEQAWTAALAGAAYCIEHRVLVDGQVRWVREQAELTFDAQGQARFGVGTVQDISQRKEAEAKLAESEANFRTFFDSSTDFLFILDSQGHIIHTNQRVKQHLGYSDRELSGLPVLQVHDEKRRDEAAQRLSEMLTNSNMHCMVPLQTRDGQLIPVESRVVPGRWNGQPALFGVSRDQSLLAASEEKFSKAFHLSPVALAISRLEDGAFIEVNRAFSQTSGYAVAEVLGRTSADLDLFIDPGFRERVLKRLTYAGSIEEMEVGIRTRSGEIRYGLFSAGSLLLQGQPVLLTQLLDISDRKAFESALEQERSMLRTLIDTLPSLIWLKDVQGRYLACNVSFEGLYGQAEVDLLGKTDYDYVDEELADFFRANDRKAIELGKSRTNEEWLTFASNGYRGLFETVKTPMHDANGQLIGVLGVARDISVKRQTEERLRLAAKVFDHANEGILICNAERNIIEINPTFSEITGYSAADVMGQNPRMLSSGRHDKKFFQTMWAHIHEQGFWRGEIWNRRKDAAVYACLITISLVRDDDGNLTHYIGIFNDITLLKTHQEKLEMLAHFDALTRLPNRVLLADRMHQAMAHARREKSLLAVCYLDLDGFKPINDTHGHEAGDQLLIEIARRLQQATRDEDTVSRLGGDEFVLLLSDIHSISQCDKAATRVLQGISAPLMVNNHQVDISASMGVTLYPRDSADADTLLRHADQAMYQAKMAGRSRYFLYDAGRDQEDRLRKESLLDIERGLLAGEFCLFYQPKVNMRHGQVAGLEALIRWEHHEQGLLTPIKFLPVLAGHELETALDWWVLEQGLRQMEAWHQLGLEMPVSINITGATLLSRGFVVRLRALLRQHENIPPGWLELEVLETAALEDMDKAGEIFKQCHALGLSIALDDFGTGYSSLTYFKRLPADTLKIDQVFIRDMLDDPDDMAIVESVVGLTRAFNRQVVAEGLENLSTGNILLQMGCDLAQGYAIAKPMPAADVYSWVETFKADPQWRWFLDKSWSTENLPLSLIGLEHRRWVEEIVTIIEDDAASEHFPRQLDPTACRFGRWYRGNENKDYATLPAFRQMFEIHEDIHKLGHQAIWFQQQGRQDQARALLPALQEKSGELLLQLDALLKQVGMDVSPQENAP